MKTKIFLLLSIFIFINSSIFGQSNTTSHLKAMSFDDMKRAFPEEDFDGDGGKGSNRRTVEEAQRLFIEHKLTKERYTAQDLNVAGMYFYEKKLYNEAVLVFYVATVMDPSHALAHYNLACAATLAPMTKYNSRDYYHVARLKDDCNIYYYIDRAIDLSEERRARAIKDSDFDRLRKQDIDYFNAIVLPPEQRKKSKVTVQYSFASSYDMVTYVSFKDNDGKQYRTYYDDMPDNVTYKIIHPILNGDHYYGSEKYEKLKGKTFEVEIIHYGGKENPEHTWWVKGLYKMERIWSIKQL